MEGNKPNTSKKKKDFFTFNIADYDHEKVSTKEGKSTEELVNELTESDEY